MSGEFPAVAATNQNVNPSTAFAAAVQKAREIAAKIQPSNSSSSESAHKRNLEDSKSGEPETKKQAILPPSPSNNSNSCSPLLNSAARVAAAAAAGIQGVGVSNLMGPVSNKDIKVPDKMVGLIIGRGGEQITRLQAESGCKIQMAPDSGGMPDRICTLTGNAQSIAKAEELIQQIVQSRSREILPLGGVGNGTSGVNSVGMQNSSSRLSDSMSSGLPPSIPTVSTPTFTQIEMMVPGPKVGLIIGKGGETIKQLQEKSGAKMVIIQDGPSQEAEKPLRISGDPQKVDHAKALVYEFMAEKEQQLQKNRGRSGGGSGGGGGGGNYNSNSNNSRTWDPEVTESSVAVPAAKCGVIIGKGGETIRQINQQTGAHCEIDRRQQANMQEKIFIIKGTPEQIENAKRMFSDKLNMNLSGSTNGPSSNYGVGSGTNLSSVSNFNGGSPWSGGPGPQSFQQQWPNSSQGQGQPQQMPQHPSSGEFSANGGGAVQINPTTGQPDYSAQWVEYYRSMGMHKEAAVIEEQAKASKSGGAQQMHAQGISSQSQLAMQSLTSIGQGQQVPIGQQQQSIAATPQPQAQGDQGGQPDYSAQWAHYYRSLGKIKEAEAIEAQMKAKAASQQTPVQPGSGLVSSQPNSSSVPSMYNQQAAALAAAQYSLGGFPSAGSAASYYGTPQPTGGAPQYAYPNYGAYQQPATNDSHQ
ncbi:far upstream element-binding protein 3 isoform X1 [Planococcus citri]|uniref:far upstream element-binding protein 3 isoform X1 n=1 Tax=Planococcus citri TaxID=170843 RepID=UPI0031F7BEE5